VQVGALDLPGTLSIPVGKGPFPAVVLVHGSWPNDRDETVGAAKVFKDLAWGLASAGVAVLRYEKRTKVVHQGVPTVKEESVDDALAGAQMLRHHERLDPKRVFVIGHSLGAYLAPWILRDDPKLAGGVMMAAPGRPMTQVLLDQFQYMVDLDPKSDAPRKALEEAKATAAQIDAKDLAPTDQVFNAPGTYWLSLRAYHPVDAAAKLTQRLLVLQGGRDYQVSPTRDFPLYQKALAGHRTASAKLYPALNHLFIAGEGPSIPAEYERAGHVASDVVADLAAWVKAP